jgi:hypothetical protein
MAVSAVLLLFFISLVSTMQIRSGEEGRQISTASIMLAQRIANAADLMHRNLCSGRGCSISLMLPNRIRGVSFTKEVDYNISFQSNWVVVTPEGYAPVSIAASIPLEGLQVSINQTEGGKLLQMEENA